VKIQRFTRRPPPGDSGHRTIARLLRLSHGL
jgi:hypothetical protein